MAKKKEKPRWYDLDYLHDRHTVVDENNIEEVIDSLDPSKHGRGLIPRDFKAKPPGCYSFAPVYPQSLIIDPSEYPTYFAKQQSGELPSLLAIREANYEVCKSLDQNGKSLCWNFSSTKASIYWTALQGEPKLFSPWYTAGLIKRWSDEGGNGDESLEKIATTGVCEMKYCPSYSSKYATAEAAANAKLNVLTNWYDAGNNIEAAMMSAGLMSYPGVGDMNDIGHSMAFCYIASINPIVTVWDNSWSPEMEQYGPKGLYIRKGRGAIPDNFFVAVGIEASTT